MDRVDLGREVDLCLQPTALVPRDVVVYCTVSDLYHLYIHIIQTQGDHRDKGGP